MKNLFKAFLAVTILTIMISMQSKACTGIRIIAEDGGVVFARTMEFGTFDLSSRIAVVPRGYTFKGLTPKGKNGKVYTAKYGFAGIDLMEKNLFADGANETGLSVGLFYHPVYVEYPEFQSSKASNTISANEMVNYLLSTFASVEEVRDGINDVNVTGLFDSEIELVVPIHWMITDKTGESIVLEYKDGAPKIHDNPLGVIINSPNYDWHMDNLNNYAGLSAFAHQPKTLNGRVTVFPVGAGSGMSGLPGDFTPPSRFVRAVAWTQTARKIEDAKETVYEIFRILDNFNLPLGPDGAEGAGREVTAPEGVRSSTVYTSAWNLADMTLNYHTDHNRRVRLFDMTKVDFDNMGDKIIYIPLDKVREQDI